jgi:hypothetical protein
VKILVHEGPKAKFSKSSETVWNREVRGIVRRAGECKPGRKSGGTQYSNPRSESRTQPSGSGRERRPVRLQKEEYQIRG